MIEKIKKTILITVASLMMTAPGLVPALAGTASADNNIQNNLCNGTNAAANGTDTGNCNEGGDSGRSTITNIASKVVNIFSLIVGAVAVIMIIYGGFRYITSGGDSNSVGSAKNTLIYAIVGLILVAMAQFLVHFVLNNASNAANNTSTGMIVSSREYS
jgi:hypothetical protein